MCKNQMPVVLLEGGLQVRVPVVCFINFIGNSPLCGAVGLEEINFNQRAEILGRVTFTFHFHALEKEMATHSSVLA